MTTSKIVSNFRRSFSFPNQPSSSKPSKSFHIRSTSLPCNSHPLISLLRSDLLSLSSSTQPLSSSSVVDVLTRLRAIHEYLDDVLQLPQTQDSLRHIPDFVEKLLEASLTFVDVFGTFQALVHSLKHENSKAQMALRRNNDLKILKIPSFLKALKKIGKEMEELVSTVGLTEKCDEIVDVDLGDVIGGVFDATVFVSISLFNGISIPLLRNTKTSLKGLRLLNKGRRERAEGGIQEFEEMRREWLKRENGDEAVRLTTLKRLQEMEMCIGKIETCSERVFRSLINTRVSLLNVLTNKY